MNKNIKKLNDELEKDLKALEIKPDKIDKTPLLNIKKLNKDLKKDLKALKSEDKKMIKKSFGGVEKSKAKAILKGIENKVLKNHNSVIKLSNFSYKKSDGIEINIKSDKFGNKEYSRKEIKKIGNKLSKYLNKKGIKGELTTAVRFQNPEYHIDMYRSGNQTEIGDDINIFDANDYEGEERAIFNTVKDFHDFTFYILVEKPEYQHGKFGGKSNYNDCLYYCLENTIKDKLPWTKPKSLKTFLKLQRCDMINIDHMEKIENKINVGINITGDFIKTSKLNSNLNIHLLLKNNHYSINHKFNQKCKNINYIEKEILMCDFIQNLGYDGKNFIPLTSEFVSEVYNFKTQYIIVWNKIFGTKISLEDEYNRYIKLADYLKEATKNKLLTPYEINLYKTGSINNTALKLFDEMTKHITPDDILDDEAQWISDSSFGAIIFSEEYEGPGYKYDIKSAYPAVISNNNVLCPVKRGNFSYINPTEFKELKFYPTGIYHCKILKSVNPNINKQFKFNKKNKYPSISLNHAKFLGLEIEIIDTETKENNILLYPRDKCLTCHQVFKSYVDYLFQFKDANKDAKLLLNIITGIIAQVNTTELTIKQDGEVVKIFDDYIIINQHKKNNGDTILELVKENHFFKSNFARFKPFLYAKGRFMISEFINPVKELVVKCNTDSMILKENAEIKTGSKIGDMVFENYYHHIKIKNNAKELVYHWCNNYNSQI